MNKYTDLKIFNQNINEPGKPILMRKKVADLGKGKYLPAFSDEWNNSVYFYNKNFTKDIAINNINVNKIVYGYLNLFFKNPSFLEDMRLTPLHKRRKFLTKIYASNVNLKYTNEKTIITVYTMNRERIILEKKYIHINKQIIKSLISRFYSLYREKLVKSFDLIQKELLLFKPSNNINKLQNKELYIKQKLKLVNNIFTWITFNSKKTWSGVIKNYPSLHLNLLRKENLLYSLNRSKYNKSTYLPILNNMLKNILGKNVEFNIINLKSLAFHPDIFTKIISLRVAKNKFNAGAIFSHIIKRTDFSLNKEKTQKYNDFLNCYKDLKLLSVLKEKSMDKSLNNIHYIKNINNTVYNSIRYKNLSGIRLELNGRLTKRYRADRSVKFLKLKGGLRNIDSSVHNLSSVLYRGNKNSNVMRSLVVSKRRIGSFAVKGWIASK